MSSITGGGKWKSTTKIIKLNGEERTIQVWLPMNDGAKARCKKLGVEYMTTYTNKKTQEGMTALNQQFAKKGQEV